jgi:hypothetical protein
MILGAMIEYSSLTQRIVDYSETQLAGFRPEQDRQTQLSAAAVKN